MQNQSSAARLTLSGSERPDLANFLDKGRADPQQTAQVTLHLKSKMSDAEMERFVNDLSAKPIAERHYLSREQLAEMRGASPEDIARVQAFASRYHLAVVETNPAARTVTVSGTLADLQAAFGVELHNYQGDGATFRDHNGSVSLPADVAPAIEGVLGLSTKPVARSHE
jgi:kumamolisin